MGKYVGFILGFGLVWAYVPNVTGSAILTGWAFLAGFLPFLLWWQCVRLSPLHWLGLGFIAWAGLSLAWTENIYDGIGAFAIWGILGMAFHVGNTTVDARPLYVGVCIGVYLCVFVAVAQAFGWRGVYIQDDFTSNVPSIFVNSTVFGTICAAVLVLGIFGGFWWSVPVSGLGLYLSGARGPAVAAIIVTLLGTYRNWSRGTALILVVPFLLFGAGVFLNKSQNLSDLEGTSRIRAAYWFDSLEALKWQGHGVGSFMQVFPTVAKRAEVEKRRPEHAYSDPIEILFEFGLPALLLFSLLILALEVPLEPERSVLFVILLSSLTYSNLAIPLVAFLAAFAAGRLSYGWIMVRHGVNLGRPDLPHWMGAEGYVKFREGREPLPLQPNNSNPPGVSGHAT